MKKRALKRNYIHIIMKVSFPLVMVFLFGSVVYANLSSAQDLLNKRVTIHAEREELKSVLQRLERSAKVRFTYTSSMVRGHKVSLDARDQSLEQVLNTLLIPLRIHYSVSDDFIILGKMTKGQTNTLDPESMKDQTVNPSIVIPPDRTVKGKVTDEKGEPLPGVSIILKGSQKGTVSNADGTYDLSVSDGGHTIIFSFVGYLTEEITISAGQTTLSLSLKIDQRALEEVVVVGYGTQTKKDLTGSVATISGSEISSRSVSNLSNALQGAVAGLSVTRSGSAPGSSGSILLRGITTLEGSSAPLILVDDVPIDNIDDVNPDQIESISILKDGASAAIYGSRAAAGVIIITTKRAKSNTFSVNYSGEQITNIPTTMPSTLGPTRYMEIYNEYMWNDAGNGADRYPSFSEELISDYVSLNRQNPDQYPITNWSDLILKKQSSGHRHNLTMSGGTDKVKTIGTFGYEKQDALYDYRKWERYTARINNDVKINERFGALFDFAFRVATSDQPSLDPTARAFSYAPIYAASWSDGRVSEGKQGDNIYAMLHKGGFSANNTYHLNGKFGIFYKPFEGLKLSVNLAPRYEFRRYKSFKKTIPYWGYNDPMMLQNPKYISGHNDKQSSLLESRDFYRTITAQAMAHYDKNLGEHHFSGVAGLETFTSESEQLSVVGREYTTGDYPFLNQAPVDRVYDNGTNISELSYASYFGRLDYNFKRRYYLQANVRRDGSSRFSSKYRWGTFPSLSAGWILSEESFFKNIKSPFNFAKVRLSYGSLGNDRLGNYLYLSTLQFMNALFSNGSEVVSQYTAAQRYLAIEDITWETTTTANVGLDLVFLRNKLSLTVDYYHKRTKNMLLNVSIPELTGYEDPMDNVGSMNTRGWELNTSWKDRVGEFNYAFSFNIFDSKSIIGDIQGKRIIGSATLSEEGSEYSAWYGYRSDGIYQSQDEVNQSATTSANVKAGDIKYLDVSGPDGLPDGLINEADRTLLGGTTLPRYQYGGTFKLDYKGIDVGVTVQGVGKQKVRLTESYVRPFILSWLSPPAIIDGNYWSHYNTEEENLQAKYPRLSQNSVNNNYVFSDFWLINGAYLRVKNLTVGYNIPQTVLGKTGISALRIYLSGNDIFSLNNYPKGMDPEYGGGYLVTKAYLLGVNLKF